MSKAAEAASERTVDDRADGEPLPAYSANEPSEPQDAPPSHFADRVKQLNPDGKQRWGDARPQTERTEWDVITVPIKVSDYGVTPLKSEQKTGTMSKLKSLVSSGSSSDEYTTIFMTRGEYQEHWAKDNSGQFKKDVTEPEGGRKAWLEEQMKYSEEYIKQEKEFKKATHKMPKDLNKRAKLKWLVVEAQDVMDW